MGSETLQEARRCCEAPSSTSHEPLQSHPFEAPCKAPPKPLPPHRPKERRRGGVEGQKVGARKVLNFSHSRPIFALLLLSGVFSWNCGHGSRPWTTQALRLLGSVVSLAICAKDVRFHPTMNFDRFGANPRLRPSTMSTTIGMGGTEGRREGTARNEEGQLWGL